ncbi:MAG: glycosyltransferase, partial [Gemmatimonadota bacterium]|nr:glycosyltransferase [Gemmatimonadota bacterium]
AGSDVFHRDVEGIRQSIRAAGTERLVHWPGFVPDEELRHLHTGAVALVLVSECEGLGLPAVEAAACGTPVVATAESPLPQLLEGGGIFVTPGNVAQTASAMRRLYEDAATRQRMGAAARLGAEQLSWQRSAGVVLEALHEVGA